MLVAGLLIGGASDTPSSAPTTSGATGVLPTVTVPAPESTGPAVISACAQLISALPSVLGGQPLRPTSSDPTSPSIEAWGDPPIVLRCGVAKPGRLTPSLSDQLLLVNHQVLMLPDDQGDTTVFTVVDRAVFIDVRVPSSYRIPPLGPIAAAVVTALPQAVCGEDTAGPRDKLCTRRK